MLSTVEGAKNGQSHRAVYIIQDIEQGNSQGFRLIAVFCRIILSN